MIVGSNPVDTVMRLSGVQCVPRALHVVADLGIADALAEQPQSSETLARATGTHVDSLDRVLRLLAGYEIFAIHNGAFVHTPASELLRSDHPHSLRSLVRMMGFPIYWRMWEAFDVTVRTGAAASTAVLPEGSWKYLADHPEEAGIFDDAMTAKSQVQIPAILRSYDFSPFARIADVGGGHGHLLRAVLAATSSTTGVLFDVPHVIQAAARSAADRLVFDAGDFFTDPLPSCDCYLVMHVLHDWNDGDATRILHAIHGAARPDATVLILESIVPDDPSPSWERILDIHMMAIHAGRERTRGEYAGLLGAAGFRPVREIDTHAGVWILEARPVSG
jgi:SAM-dependent methyltransferase